MGARVLFFIITTTTTQPRHLENHALLSRPRVIFFSSKLWLPGEKEKCIE